MILAEKIVKLRKQMGWSQEELAEKTNVSRQSVSKWESANSIPDLSKILLLSEIFSVSTDFLLKDEIEIADVLNEGKEPGIVQINLEQAMKYIDDKMAVAALTAKGVALCLTSVVPLFFFLALAETNRFGLSSEVATAAGIFLIVVMIAIAVSFFIRTNHYQKYLALIENEKFELAYGVHSVFEEKLQQFRSAYNTRLSISVFLFIACFVPLMFVNVFSGGSDSVLMMLIVMLFMIALGIYIILPASTKYEAFNNILKEESIYTHKSKRSRRAEKLAAFYWPLLTAIYLGWSLWTMDWGITWIVWPVGGVLFAALVGLMELLDKEVP